MTDLTPSQEEAVSKALDFALGSTDREHFAISGLAGTGKTTTLVQLVDQLQQAGMKVAVCAPTGKAATVINKKQSVFTARTIHSCFMQSMNSKLDDVLRRLDELELTKRQNGGSFTASEQKEFDNLITELDQFSKRKKNDLTFTAIEAEKWLEQYDMVVFDESSMIGHKTQALFSHIPCKKIFFGDSSQLPPVQDETAIDLEHADVHLKEVLRQAGDSFIIPLSHTIAKLGRYPARKDFFGKKGITAMTNDEPLVSLKYAADHQIIVWTNPARHLINPEARIVRGFDNTAHKYPWFPCIGETLMIAKNSPSQRLTRGDQIEILSADVNIYEALREQNPYVLSVTCKVVGEDTPRAFDIECVDLMDCYEHPKGFGEKELAYKKSSAWKNAISVQFPYTITCHTAQGSEWDNVYVCGQYPKNRSDWRKWAYTAVTRARSNLVIADKAIR